MEFHELSNIFEMLIGNEFVELCKSIHGGYDPNFPIITYEGKILDGRNRYAACLHENITPIYKEYIGDDPIAFVVLANVRRRHLTPAQLAFAAVEVKRLYAEQAKKNQQIAGQYNRNPEQEQLFANLQKAAPVEPINATVKAAEQLGVSQNYVSAAAKISEDAPDIAQKGRSGEWNMNRVNKEYKKRKKVEAVKVFTEKMKSEPQERKIYNVIYADPPWQYSEGMNTLDAVTDDHYPTMNLEQVKTYLNDNNIRTQENSVLFLWVTNPFLKKALEVVEAWGFEYKTNIAWVKTELKKPGVGYYVRGRHELLFICTKESFTPLDNNTSPPIGSVLESPVNEHSQKPKEVYEIIQRLYPGCVYLELFARNRKDGWDSIGNEL